MDQYSNSEGQFEGNERDERKKKRKHKKHHKSSKEKKNNPLTSKAVTPYQADWEQGNLAKDKQRIVESLGSN